MKNFLEALDQTDIKEMDLKDLIQLASKMRTEIIDVLSKNGGHLASNLGTVELSIALHKVFNSPDDQFIFDVGHQSYTHKLLTKRASLFPTIRKHQGLSGFTSPEESKHDHFFAGHAGTALSLALGSAKARDLSQKNHHVIPILGDASLTCGLTLEALNNIPKSLSRFILILNDNKMSISENVGAITQILSRLINHPKSNRFYREFRHQLEKIPGFGQYLADGGSKVKTSIKNLFSPAPFFEQFNLAYVGIVDGHNLQELIEKLEAVKNEPKAVILHVSTIKGYGMDQAILNPTCYHGVKPFDKITGHFLKSEQNKTFPQVFGQILHEMATSDEKIVVITPAMPQGSCLEACMKTIPNRCIDVGIAEGHALTYAGGIAKDSDKKVVVSIYSTFLQRALDNLFHDICLQKLPCLIALDRSGLSPQDGPTHHGIYDIGFLQAMPNLVIAQPRSANILRLLMQQVFSYQKPTVIRYPNLPAEIEANDPMVELGKGHILQIGSKVLIITLGHLFHLGKKISDLIKTIHGFEPTLFDPIFLKPLDVTSLKELLCSHDLIVTIEEHSIRNGLGNLICQQIANLEIPKKKIQNFGVPDRFIEHGSYANLMQEIGLTAESIYEEILKNIPSNN